MKKNKLTTAERKAAAKRGEKRALRLKKTQKEKHLRKMKLIEERKKLAKKQEEFFERLMKARYSQA
jgi:hypothetical protein